MLRIDFVTLFPEMVQCALGHSILKRAQEAGLVSFHTVNPRDFTTDSHRTVDDKPLGGGPGMVMMAEPIVKAIRSLKPEANANILLPDARGPLFTQEDARRLSKAIRIILICGHYGGVDDRVRSLLGARPVSIGDYVLTGGELPALVIADSVIRLLPGALGHEESADLDSFADGLLSAPQFTQPAKSLEEEAPSVLLSGDHGAARRWKRKAALMATRALRPDVFWRAKLENGDADMLCSEP